MRVLFTIPNFETAGSGHALLQLALGLKQKGFDIHIMAKHDRGRLVRIIRENNIPFHVCAFESPARPIIQLLIKCWRTSRVFRKIAPNVIYSYHYSADYSEPLAAMFSRISWIYVKKNMSWYGPSQNAWLIRSFLAQKINIQNTEMVEEFLHRFSKKLVHIPIGVDTNVFKPKHDEKVETFIFIHVSSLLPVKGIKVLLQAYALFCKEVCTKHQLLIIGPTEDEFVKDLITKYKSIPSITFLGKQQNIPEHLNKADCFIQSSLNQGRREGAPIALQEAMSTGLVCIGSRVAGINDQLCGFEHLQYDAENAHELKDRMIEVFHMSEQQRRDLGDQLRQRVFEHYSLEQEIERTAALLFELK